MASPATAATLPTPPCKALPARTLDAPPRGPASSVNQGALIVTPLRAAHPQREIASIRPSKPGERCVRSDCQSPRRVNHGNVNPVHRSRDAGIYSPCSRLP